MHKNNKSCLIDIPDDLWCPPYIPTILLIVKVMLKKHLEDLGPTEEDEFLLSAWLQASFNGIRILLVIMSLLFHTVLM